MANVTAYFPGPIAALHTPKSGVVTGPDPASCLSCAARPSTARRMSAAAGSPGRSTAR
ncbi:hypothetical protein ACTPOK_10640 [Streptomyces inhibens]|uniref:hypothetical protein n=1 Tax=Streptomyces inhibens TaxID=2293571 RepID=UPI00402A62B3